MYTEVDVMKTVINHAWVNSVNIQTGKSDNVMQMLSQKTDKVCTESDFSIASEWNHCQFS